MSECVGGSCIRDGYSAHDVLKLLYSGARCQKDIVKHFCITKAACSIHFKRLSEEGFIESYEERSNRKGRPSLQWRLKSEGNYFCGVLLNDGIFSVTLKHTIVSRDTDFWIYLFRELNCFFYVHIAKLSVDTHE